MILPEEVPFAENVILEEVVLCVRSVPSDNDVCNADELDNGEFSITVVKEILVYSIEVPVDAYRYEQHLSIVSLTT